MYLKAKMKLKRPKYNANMIKLWIKNDENMSSMI